MARWNAFPNVTIREDGSYSALLFALPTPRPGVHRFDRAGRGLVLACPVGKAVTGPSDTGEMSPLVEFIVKNPGLSESLLRQHVDDGQGYCRACALGAQRGYFRFPCDIRRTAERANVIERSRR